ncbi:MAG: beta-lactamase family protein [Chlorobia bacterium]|nr:beta-lactamase family protein [Fimbriimonadaceae bacterium]
MPALSLLLVSVCLSPQLPSQAEFDARLDRAFVASKVPGAGIRVAKDGRVVYEKAFGVADEVDKAPTTVNMAFEIGSLSKQFTAVAALMLVQDGKLKLDEMLGAAIPDLPTAWRSATLDQVLHHMSGVPDYEEIATYDFYNLPRQPKEIIEQAAKKEPAFKPGEKFEYSNTGYFLISMIVEKKSGMPLSRFMQNRMFDKLGMKSTYTYPKPSQVKTMTGYHSRSGTRTKQPAIAWTSTLGAGGIVSTLDDLMRWDEALYTEKLLKKDLLAKIWTPTKFNDGTVNTYGYGWFSTTFRGQKELNHSGQTNGFTCIYRRYPDQHASVWAFCNTYDGNVFGMARAALIRYVPGLNYAALPIPANQDGEQTKKHFDLVRKACSGESTDAMGPNIKDFATNARFADVRKELLGYLNASNDLKFLRTTTRTTASGAQVQDNLYHQTIPNGVKYWTVGFSGGLMSGLLIEDE